MKEAFKAVENKDFSELERKVMFEKATELLSLGNTTTSLKKVFMCARTVAYLCTALRTSFILDAAGQVLTMKYQEQSYASPTRTE